MISNDIDYMDLFGRKPALSKGQHIQNIMKLIPFLITGNWNASLV